MSQAYQQILKALKTLSFPELKRLQRQVSEEISSNEVSKAIADREASVSHCPHCQSESINRHGVNAKGVQRYQCKECRRTFNALAGTPLFRMRKEEKWVKYLELMASGTSLREIADRLDINLKTAFKWRHRFLSRPRDMKASTLQGIIEADETFINENHKGKRKLDRPARKRGGGKSRKIPIFLALDRSGAKSHHVLERKTKDEIERSIAPLLTDGSVLCTDGNLSYVELVKTRNIDHKRIVGLLNQRVVEGVYHIQGLNNFTMRWKTWLRRFSGVGTDYLDNYLGWFRFMDDMKNLKTSNWLDAAL